MASKFRLGREEGENYGKSTNDWSITGGLIILSIIHLFYLKVDWSLGGNNSSLLDHLAQSKQSFSSLIWETLGLN